VSEAYRHVMSISVMAAILTLISTLTFILLLYTDMSAAQRAAEMARDRLLELIAYGAAERCVLKLSLSDVISRPFEVYVVNETHAEIRVPLKIFTWARGRSWLALPEGVRFSYAGLLPSSSYLRFREAGGEVVVEVRSG